MQTAAVVAAAASNRNPNASPTPPTMTTTATLPTTKTASSKPLRKTQKTLLPETLAKAFRLLICNPDCVQNPIFLEYYKQNPIQLFCPKPLF